MLQSVNEMSREQLLALVATMREGAQRRLTLKVSAKGAVSLYGMGKWPVTLYRGQWEKLFGEIDHIKAFIEANAAVLAVKE